MEPITDDYVAEILRKDAAKKNTSDFVLGSLLWDGKPSKKRSDAPKPNTRFLKHIVQEADTHNAALRRKEEEESRQRLNDLKREEERKRERAKDREGGREKRRRNELLAHLRPSEKDERRTKRRREDEGRRRSRSPERERDGERRYKRRRSGHLDIKGYAERRHAKSSGRLERPTSDNEESQSSNIGYLKPVHSDSDSDPLESVIGPKPPPKVRPRGRGANNESSMDTRFDPTYDPSTDVGRDLHNDDGDDWNMALEALRDRAKWRKSGAERLKAAGFTEEEIAKWENGGGGKRDAGDGERDISDVRWSKKGEDREWDRGKVLEDGSDHVGLKPEWGRLKGT